MRRARRAGENRSDRGERLANNAALEKAARSPESRDAPVKIPKGTAASIGAINHGRQSTSTIESPEIARYDIGHPLNMAEGHPRNPPDRPAPPAACLDRLAQSRTASPFVAAKHLASMGLGGPAESMNCSSAVSSLPTSGPLIRGLGVFFRALPFASRLVKTRTTKSFSHCSRRAGKALSNAALPWSEYSAVRLCCRGFWILVRRGKSITEQVASRTRWLWRLPEMPKHRSFSIARPQ